MEGCNVSGGNGKLQRGKEKEYLLGEEEQKCAAQSNGEIQELMTHLAAVMEEMDSSMRKNLRPCFLAGEAMHILNRIGSALSGKEERQDLITLAEDLEHWFYHYKKQWRVVSQESELFQVVRYYLLVCGLAAGFGERREIGMKKQLIHEGWQMCCLEDQEWMSASVPETSTLIFWQTEKWKIRFLKIMNIRRRR